MKVFSKTSKTIFAHLFLYGALVSCLPTSCVQEDDGEEPDYPNFSYLNGPAIYQDRNANGHCDAGDTIMVSFTESIYLPISSEEAGVDDLFILTSAREGGYEVNDETFGEGAYIDLQVETSAEAITITLGEEPYLKARQRHGEGDDTYYATGIDLASSPSEHFKIHGLQDVRSGGPKDITPSMTLGDDLMGEADVRSVALADLDSDGDMDVVCGTAVSMLEGEVSIMLNNGQLPVDFSIYPPTLPIGLGTGGSRAVTALECADFDGDGDIDILALGPVPGERPLWLNQPGFTFAPANGHVLVGATADDCAVGDLDADGDLDLILADSASQTIAVYENNGGSIYGSAPSIQSVPGVKAVTIFDLDSNGFPDLLTAGSGVGGNGIWFNDGSAVSLGLGLAPDTLYWGADAQDVQIADVNADGAMDIIAVPENEHLNGPGTMIRYTNGFGGLGEPHVALETGESMAWADFDSDGWIDMVVDRLLSGGATVVSGYRHNPETFQLDNGSSWARSLSMGDLDGDGDIDLVAVTGDGNCLPILNSVSGVRGRLALRYREPVSFGEALTTDLVDVDHDGDLDLVALANVALHFNDGAGGFSPAPQGLDMSSASDLALGDIDGDSDVDIVAAWNSSNPLAVGVSFLINVDGVFTQSANSLDTQGIVRIDLADVDGDGSLDLLCDSASDTSESLYLNNGTGEFTLHGYVSTVNFARSTSFCDMNGDGTPDLVRASSALGVEVRLNDGHGNLSTAFSTAVSSDAICTADVDGDGDADIIAQDGARIRTLLNQGDGRQFTFDSEFGNSFAHELQACDIDDDGDQDILVAGSGVAEPVWMNDGQGNFTDSGPLVPGSSRTVAVGDVDADGDRDLILSDIYSGGVNILRSE